MKMKICIISTSAIPVPPESYSGLEALMGWLTMEFVKHGHDVTLITTKGSEWDGSHPIVKDGKQIATMTVLGTIEPSWNAADEKEHYQIYRHILEKEFGDGNNSVVLDNTWFCYSYFSKQEYPSMNIVHTHHGMLGFRHPPPNIIHPRFVGLSNGHAHYLSSGLNIPVRVIHNGIPLPQYDDDNSFDPFQHKGEYLLSLNRITAEKGIHDAIDVAIQNKQKIVVVGDDTHVVDQNYVHQIIERCRNSNGLAQYLGLVDNPTKNTLIENCRALIACPKNSWVEASGLYVFEGLARYKPFLGTTGTLFKHGYNDVIQNGVNGFLAESPAELSKHILEIDAIDPFVCRKTVEQGYTKEIMAQRYLDTCQKIIDNDSSAFW
jgi:glycosyltransferase involved in cell wall biosynthesis